MSKNIIPFPHIAHIVSFRCSPDENQLDSTVMSVLISMGSKFGFNPWFEQTRDIKIGSCGIGSWLGIQHLWNANCSALYCRVLYCIMLTC